MGQQQLLLIVIGIVIVGLAVLGGFDAFNRHVRQDEADGLLDRGLSIATHAVHWKTVNDPFNGGNQSYAELAVDGLDRLAVDESTIRGQFAITSATADQIEVTGVSDRYPEVGIRVFVTEYVIDSSYVRFDGSLSL
ncbi:MAG: hypothetical protein HKN04_05010 [Rhodothermaceae bacterium]|nr:hypothetical protein [Rhodothermaceae bacterium]